MKIINVTQRDINRASSHYLYCPIDFAAMRALKTNHACTSASIISTRRKEYSLPRKAILFIERFDDEKPVKPFKFKIKCN